MSEVDTTGKENPLTEQITYHEKSCFHSPGVAVLEHQYCLILTFFMADVCECINNNNLSATNILRFREM